MNKKVIERLARKSGLAYAVDVGCGFPDIKYPDNYEKFAELLIKEVLTVVNASRNPPNLNYKPTDRIADEITLYFF